MLNWLVFVPVLALPLLLPRSGSQSCMRSVAYEQYALASYPRVGAG